MEGTKEEKKQTYLEEVIKALGSLSGNYFDVIRQNELTLGGFRGSEPKDTPGEDSEEPATDKQRVDILLFELEKKAKVLSVQAEEFASII